MLWSYGLPALWRWASLPWRVDFLCTGCGSSCWICMDCGASVTSFSLWTGCGAWFCICPVSMDPGTCLWRKRKFCINIFPLAVQTCYCLWGNIKVTSPYVSHDLVLVFCTPTRIPTVMSGRLLGVKLYLAAAASCDCCVCRCVSSLLYCYSGKKPTDVWEGCLVWGGHTAFGLVKTNLSLMVCYDTVWGVGMAWTYLFKNRPLHATLSTFFIAFTVASALLLIWE